MTAQPTPGTPAEQQALWQVQVIKAECRFAASMAQRDAEAFGALVSEQAIFMGGPQPLLGRAAVRAGWRAYFESPQAPFSWAPDQVVVNGEGSLAHSTGLVRNPQGQAISRFYSVWRQEASGLWRVVVDRGGALSEAERATDLVRSGLPGAGICP